MTRDSRDLLDHALQILRRDMNENPRSEDEVDAGIGKRQGEAVAFADVDALQRGVRARLLNGLRIGLHRMDLSDKAAQRDEVAPDIAPHLEHTFATGAACSRTP